MRESGGTRSFGSPAMFIGTPSNGGKAWPAGDVDCPIVPALSGALSEAARAAVKLDRSKVAPDVGLRAAVGVATTLVVGWVTGHTVDGVMATIGAISGGFASHQGTYRSRAAVVLVATLAMGVAALMGSTMGHVLGAFAVLASAVAFVAGLLVSLGPAAMVVGAQAVVGLVVFSQFNFPIAVAARDAGLILLGGVVQTLLVVVLWPMRRFPAERRALSSAFAALAQFCRDAGTQETPLLAPDALSALDPLMRDAQPFGGEEGAAMQAMVAQADRVRLELVALARTRQRLSNSRACQDVEELLWSTAGVLDNVAASVRDNSVPAGWSADRDRFESALERLRSQPRSQVAEIIARAEALAGQVRTVIRAAAALAGGDAGTLESVAPSGPAIVGPRQKRRGAPANKWLATVRSNLTFSSQAFRHALRLAVAVAVADLVSRTFSMAHHYWLPMTTVLVLRPDFSSTVTRGLSRVAGTLIGAGLVTLVLAEAHPSPEWLIAITVALYFPAVTLVLANYAAFSVFIASLVVTLLAFAGEPGVAAAGERSIYTVAGAAVALVAYLVWPTWEAKLLPDTLAGLAEIEGLYAQEVLVAWADPPRADRATLQQARIDARLARSNAEAAVARWLSEPQPLPEGNVLTRAVVAGFMTAVRSCVQAVLALHAALPSEGPGCPAASGLGTEVRQAMGAVAAKLRERAAPVTLPPLRREQLALASRAGGAPALAGETDLLVNSVNTLAHLVGIDDNEGEKDPAPGVVTREQKGGRPGSSAG